MRKSFSTILLLTFAVVSSRAADPPGATVRHVTVYHEPGRFGGWPANYGIWFWGEEILVGFSRGYYKDLGERHHIDRDRPEEHMLARSFDGGETWSIERPSQNGFIIAQGDALHGTETPGVKIPPARPIADPIDFEHPDFAMTVRMLDIDAGPSQLHYSYDRGHTWRGPFALPDLGTRGIAGRTDYLVSGRHEAMLFLTAAKANGQEGRPLCASTSDGGLSWRLRSWIGPEPPGFAIMPASERVSAEEIYVAVRRREGPRRWLDAYRSLDDGRTWTPEAEPVADLGVGNPPSLIRLTDGRLCLTYGVRGKPYRIAAKLSPDGGRTWSAEIVLRDDGKDQDVGYVRSAERPDGNVVTIYYFNDETTGPERYIGASIWAPGQGPKD